MTKKSRAFVQGERSSLPRKTLGHLEIHLVVEKSQAFALGECPMLAKETLGH